MSQVLLQTTDACEYSNQKISEHLFFYWREENKKNWTLPTDNLGSTYLRSA